MGENLEVIPQQEMHNDLVRRSEMCIGWKSMMTVPKNTVTSVVVMRARPVTSDILKKTQLVTNVTLKIIQSMQYTHQSHM